MFLSVRSLFVSSCLSLLLSFQGNANVLQISATADGYDYLGAPTPVYSTRHYMDVGLFGTYGDHFSVGFLKFSTDLSALANASSIFLAIHVKNFVAPIFGRGITNPPTSTSYPTTGGNFTLKAAALNSPFPSAGVDAAWVQNNVILPGAAGTVVLQTAGLAYMDVTSTVKGWIENASTVKELALVGIASTPNTWSVWLGTREDEIDLDGLFVSAASPMYLTPIPEPSGSFLVLAAFVVGALKKRRKN